MAGAWGKGTEDETMSIDISSSSANYQGEMICQRPYSRLITCLRESQDVDIMYDCRSRMIDIRECVNRHKQNIWVFRETVATMRNEKKFRKWLADWDKNFGQPPLLEAVLKTKNMVDRDGGMDILNPTVFKDPDIWVPPPRVTGGLEQLFGGGTPSN
jgi:hypothetical protein